MPMRALEIEFGGKIVSLAWACAPRLSSTHMPTRAAMTFDETLSFDARVGMAPVFSERHFRLMTII
jgi:hypothetical protein